MGLRSWFLATAAVIGLNGNVQAEEKTEKKDFPEGHRIELATFVAPEQTNAVDEIITGKYKGINFEVIHSNYQVTPVDKQDSIAYRKMIDNTAETNNWPTIVAEDVASRAVAFNMIYKYSRDDMKEAFLEQDKRFTNKLSEDLDYIETHGAEAYMTNILKKGKTVDFESARTLTQHKHKTPGGISYSFSENGSVLIEGNIRGGRIDKLLPKYESENSDKTSPHGFYLAYKNSKGYYQCGESVAQNPNVARMTEMHKLQLIYAHDEICKDMQNRLNAGENLSNNEIAFMKKHSEQLKKRGIIHDAQGNMVLGQQLPMQNKSRGRNN